MYELITGVEHTQSEYTLIANDIHNIPSNSKPSFVIFVNNFPNLVLPYSWHEAIHAIKTSHESYFAIHGQTGLYF